MLVRNTTWTASRDGTEGAAFATTTFYDGQGMMVRGRLGLRVARRHGRRHHLRAVGHHHRAEPGDACSTPGASASTPLPLRRGRPDPRGVPRRASATAGPRTSSQLAGLRSAWPEARAGPTALVIFDEIFSKEPLGPAVRDGDDEWFDAVNWAVHRRRSRPRSSASPRRTSTEQLESDDPDILRFLGQPTGEDDDRSFDPGLGLEPDFAVDGDHRGRQLRRDLRPQRRAGHAARPRAGPQRPVERRRPGLLYAPPYR